MLKRKLTAFVLLMTFVMGCVPFNVYGDTITSGNCGTSVNYSLNQTTGVLTISGSGAMTSYSWGGAPWDSKSSYVKNVVIENGVTSIGDNAFRGCTSLTSVTIPDSVTSIGDYAFHNCRFISVTIPEGVTSIGDNAFSSCSRLTSVTIPDSVTSIGYYVFGNCISLTSITIPEGVTSIGNYAFYYCNGLTSVTIPDSVTEINYRAFYGCSKLESVFASENCNLSYIGVDAFYNTLIEDNTEFYIGNVLYKYNGTDENYTIREGTKVIYSNAFAHNLYIEKIVIPNTVKTIGRYAFWNCLNLKEINIPASVETIDDYSFVASMSCTYTTEEWVDGDGYYDPETDMWIGGAEGHFESYTEYREYYIPLNISLINYVIGTYGEDWYNSYINNTEIACDGFEINYICKDGAEDYFASYQDYYPNLEWRGSYIYPNCSTSCNVRSIKVSQPENGKVEVSASKVYVGDSLGITLTPNEGYKAKAIIINDEEIECTGSYTLTNIVEDVEVSGVFEREITAVAEVPEISEENVLGGKKITLSSATENANIYYAIDKANGGSFVKYTEPFVIDNYSIGGQVYITVYSEAENYLNSEEKTYTVTLEQANSPLANYESMEVYRNSKISLTSKNNDVDNTIYYTIDGSVPTVGTGTLYTGEITVNKDMTIKAIAVGSGLTVSEVSEYRYTIGKVKKPVISAKAVIGGQQVTITSETADSKIYYKIGEDDYTEYSKPFIVDKTNTVSAYACHERLNDSDVTEASVVIGKVDTPTANIESGQVLIGYKVVLSDWENADIYYTIDGSEPSEESIKYTEPIEIKEACDIKAIAVLQGFEKSDILSLSYTIKQVGDIRIDKKIVGQYKEITLATDTEGAVIYYTTDGSVPDTESSVYSEPLNINETTTIKAIAVKNGYLDSNLTTEIITISKVNAPTANIAQGEVKANTNLSLYTSNLNGLIYYTTDGSEPSSSSNLLNIDSPIVIDKDMVVKAIVIDSSGELLNSDVLTLSFTIIKANAPVEKISNVMGGKEISLTSSTEGAKIYYTIAKEGEEEVFKLYENPFIVEEGVYIKAYTEAEGYAQSNVAEISVEVPKAEIYVYNYKNGNYFKFNSAEYYGFDGFIGEELGIKVDEGITVYYTDDGSEPTYDSKVYNNDIYYSLNETNVRMFAVGMGIGKSEELNRTLYIKASPDPKIISSTIDDSNEEVSISCNNVSSLSKYNNFDIYYTTDGTEPTINSNLYSEPFVVSENCTIKAIAVNEYTQVKSIGKYDVVIGEKMPVPVVYYKGNIVSRQGVYIGDAVTLACENENAKIYYTTDGTLPNETSKLYEGEEIVINDSTYIYAYAVDSSREIRDSNITLCELYINSAGLMNFIYGTEIYGGYSINLNIDDNATAYYGINEKIDKNNPNIYTEPFILTYSATINAFAFGDRMKNSEESQSFTVENLTKPTASVNDSKVLRGTIVELSAINSAEIYYTTDGGIPDENSTLYTEPFVINDTVNIKAIAMKKGCVSSDVAEFNYSILQTAQVLETEKILASGVEITLSCETEGAKIYYTTDGSIPSENSTLYTAPFKISKTSTINAYAVTENMLDSELLSNLVVINNADINYIGIGSTEGSYGEILTVPVAITKNPGVAAYNLQIQFDPTIVMPIRVYKNENWRGMLVTNCADDNLGNTLNISWTGTEDVFTSGDMVYIEFEIIGQGDTSLMLNNNGVIDRYYSDADVAFGNGEITMTKEEQAPALMSVEGSEYNKPVTLTVEKSVEGDSVKANIYLSNNIGIAAYDLSLVFNSEILEPISITNGDVFESDSFSNIYEPNKDLSSLSQVKLISCNDGNSYKDGKLACVEFKIKNTEVYNEDAVSLVTDLCQLADEFGNAISCSQETENIWCQTVENTNTLEISNGVLMGKVDITVNNLSGFSKNADVILAVFDEKTNELLYAKQINSNLENGENNITIEINESIEISSPKCKIFVWEGNDSLKPISEPIDVEIK